jgi:hypothetical protein
LVGTYHRTRGVQRWGKTCSLGTSSAADRDLHGMDTARRPVSETEDNRRLQHHLAVPAFHRAVGGQGKRAWLCAHLGAWRCSRQGKVSAQHLQISGTKAEHTEKAQRRWPVVRRRCGARGSDGAALQRDGAKPLVGEVVAFLGGSSTRPAAPALVSLFKRRWEFLLGVAQHPMASASAWRRTTGPLVRVWCTHRA